MANDVHFAKFANVFCHQKFVLYICGITKGEILTGLNFTTTVNAICHMPVFEMRNQKKH